MSQPMVKEEAVRERECEHRRRGASGEFYRGTSYVQALMQLRGAAAAKFSNRVTAFFWADAPHVIVWLCRECAGELKLNEG